MNDLTLELSKYVNVEKRFSYLFMYNLVKLKRFFALNVMAFSFQYLCIYHLQSTYPVYPIYPAMGITFTVVSLLGENAILGLLLGSVCAYFLKNFNGQTIILYSLADIACAGVGAYLCRNIFASDIPKHATMVLWMRFVLISALVSGISGFFRVTALLLNEASLPSWKAIFFIYLNLSLADLNAIIVFYAFLSTWLSIYMSREKVSFRKISYYQIIAFVAFVALSIAMMKHVALIYLLFMGIVATIFLACFHGVAIGTLLMYVISMLYLSYFTVHQVYYLKWLKISGYTLVPGLLLCVVLSMLLVASNKKRYD